MGAETKITVSLPTEVVADLEASVADGRYASPGEAIAEALDELAYRRFESEIGVEKLRALLEAGVNSGPSVDGEAVFERLIKKYEAMARERGE